MRLLSPSDAAALCRVICFPNLSEKRRTEQLRYTSNEAKAVGRILIKGIRKGDKKDWIRLAKKLQKWSEENSR